MNTALNIVFEKLGKEAHAFAVADSGPVETRHLVYRRKYNELILREVLSLVDASGNISADKVKKHFGIVGIHIEKEIKNGFN